MQTRFLALTLLGAAPWRLARRKRRAGPRQPLRQGRGSGNGAATGVGGSQGESTGLGGTTGALPAASGAGGEQASPGLAGAADSGGWSGGSFADVGLSIEPKAALWTAVRHYAGATPSGRTSGPAPGPTKELALHNGGDGALTLSVSLSGPDAARFTLLTPAQLEIAAGSDARDRSPNHDRRRAARAGAGARRGRDRARRYARAGHERATAERAQLRIGAHVRRARAHLRPNLACLSGLEPLTCRAGCPTTRTRILARPYRASSPERTR